jgi:peptide/nickel transport system substrate-binding protein
MRILRRAVAWSMGCGACFPMGARLGPRLRAVIPCRDRVAALLAAGIVVAGCAPSPGGSPEQRAADAAPSGAPKQITAAIRSDPPVLYSKLSAQGTSLPGLDALEDLVQAGLATSGEGGITRAQLAEQLPTVENGLWRVFPDGRMETRWTIRAGAQWHDGTPFTTSDLLFSADLARDPELGNFSDAAYGFLDRLQAVDDRTLVAYWNRPYIAADMLFWRRSGNPLPRHLLERTYLENKAAFLLQPYWAEEFVGLGPFKVRAFERGSHVLLEAHGGYVLGRPRIDLMEVKFIPSAETVTSNLLAGTVDVTIGRTLTLEGALQMKDRWPAGQMIATPNTLVRMSPQMVDPQPADLANVQVRRALFHALDRQSMIDTFQSGLTAVAHTILPDHPRFAEIEANVPHYDYDPRRATQLLAASGLTQAADGMLRDASGRALPPVELRAPANSDQQVSLIHVVADHWQRVGVPTELEPVPLQRTLDREYSANRPGFNVSGGISGLDAIPRLWHSSQVPSPRNRFTGNNDSRWSTPEMDGLIDRYLATIPEAERMGMVRQIMTEVMDVLPIFPMFYEVEPTMVSNRLKNVGGRSTPYTQAWNAQEWTLQ